MKTQRKCLICGVSLNFKACETKNDVCSEACNEIFIKIPAINQYGLFPTLQFIGGIPRRLFRVEKLIREDGLTKIIKIRPSKRIGFTAKKLESHRFKKLKKVVTKRKRRP